MRRMPCGASVIRPMQPGGWRPAVVLAAILALAVVANLAGGCKSNDATPAGVYPYHGQIEKPDGTTPHVPGAAQ